MLYSNDTVREIKDCDLPNVEPVKRFEDVCDMRKFRSRDNSSSEIVMDALEAVKLIFRKTE